MIKRFTSLALLCAFSFAFTPASHGQALDPAFQPSVLKAPYSTSLQSAVNTLAVQPDGKVLAAGGFDFVNGEMVGKLQQFTKAGKLDPSFSGLNTFGAPHYVQPDGRIIATASPASSISGNVNTQLVRLNPDGSRDLSFVPVAIPHSVFIGDDFLTGVTREFNGDKLVLFGSFRSVAGQVRLGLARLTTGPLSAAAPGTISRLPLAVFPNPAFETLTVQLPATASVQRLQLVDINGRVVRQLRVSAAQPSAQISLQAVANGVYLVQAVGTSALYQQRVVVAH